MPNEHRPLVSSRPRHETSEMQEPSNFEFARALGSLAYEAAVPASVKRAGQVAVDFCFLVVEKIRT